MFCKVSCFSIAVDAGPGGGADLLSRLAAHRVDLLGMTVTQARPAGSAAPGSPVLTLFTADPAMLQKAARLEKIALDEPQTAILVQNPDCHGAIAELVARLVASGVTVSSLHAMADGRGRVGCLVVLPSDQVDRALRGLAQAA